MRKNVLTRLITVAVLVLSAASAQAVSVYSAPGYTVPQPPPFPYPAPTAAQWNAPCTNCSSSRYRVEIVNVASRYRVDVMGGSQSSWTGTWLWYDNTSLAQEFNLL